MLKTKTKTNSNYVKIHSLFDKITKQKQNTTPTYNKYATEIHPSYKSISKKLEKQNGSIILRFSKDLLLPLMCHSKFPSHDF